MVAKSPEQQFMQVLFSRKGTEMGGSEEQLTHRNMTKSAGRVFVAEGALAAAPDVIRLGTRRSRLALAQSTQVAEEIAQVTGADVALITVTTEGDTSREPLSQLGGTGVFVSALRQALADGHCDIAVHSHKDLPTGPCPGIVVGAVPLRADPRDAWCANDNIAFAEAPRGFRVGTGSPRRTAQLLARRPDLAIVDIRGNVDTRLKRLEQDLDAIVLAAAGLTRCGRADAITERFSLESVPPAPGQGALALEVRNDAFNDQLLRKALSAVDHEPTRITAMAERALLATLEAGCAAPVGVSAVLRPEGLTLRAVVYRTDGTEQLESEHCLTLKDDTNAEEVATELGRVAARDLLARGAESLADLGRKSARE